MNSVEGTRPIDDRTPLTQASTNQSDISKTDKFTGDAGLSSIKQGVSLSKNSQPLILKNRNIVNSKTIMQEIDRLMEEIDLLAETVSKETTDKSNTNIIDKPLTEEEKTQVENEIGLSKTSSPVVSGKKKKERLKKLNKFNLSREKVTKFTEKFLRFIIPDKFQPVPKDLKEMVSSHKTSNQPLSQKQSKESSSPFLKPLHGRSKEEIQEDLRTPIKGWETEYSDIQEEEMRSPEEILKDAEKILYWNKYGKLLEFGAATADRVLKNGAETELKSLKQLKFKPDQLKAFSTGFAQRADEIRNEENQADLSQVNGFLLDRLKDM